jgi:hypothetical protein
VDSTLPESPAPYCPFCKHTLDPATDVLYNTLSFGAGMIIIYCGWCGAVLGGGISGGKLFTKTSRE